MSGLRPDVLGRDVYLLCRGMLARQRHDGAAQRRIPDERVLTTVENHLARRGRLGLGVPREEPIHMRVVPQAGRKLLGHEIEAPGAQVRMVHRRQRFEHRTVERPAKVQGHVGRGLFADLAEDDAGL